jgi:hypothetical protein
MEIDKNISDKIYEKSKKIRIQLLLYSDNQIRRIIEKDNNKRYIKKYNPKNYDCMKVSFQQSFTNNNSKIMLMSSFPDKEKFFDPDIPFIFFSNKSETSKTLTNSSKSSLQTTEHSCKKKLTISKLIIHKKVIPENLFHLLETNKKLYKKNWINNYTNSIYSNNSNSFNEDINSNDDIDKYQLYLEDLCDNFRYKYC